MFNIEEEIISAIYSLGIPPNEFVILSEQSAVEVIAKIKERFVARDAYFIWESLSSISIVLDCSDESTPYILPQYIPTNDVFVYLIPAVDRPYKPVFQIMKNWLTDLLLELPFFEYSIVSTTYEWLLVETHHGQLIGSGEIFTRRTEV